MKKKKLKNKSIFIYSVGRSDIYRILPIIYELNKKSIDLKIILSEVHYDIKYGLTYKDVKLSKLIYSNPKKRKVSDFTISREIHFLIDLFKKKKPDLLIVFGDRFDMLAAPVASINFNIPILHFYGGAITNYAIDELARHSISKMSHFHMVATEEYKKNLIQMGEEKKNIKVIGVPEIQFLKNQKKMNDREIEKIFKIDFSEDVLLVTFHPVTLQLQELNYQIKNLLEAIKQCNINTIFTYPNIDKKNNFIIKKFKNFVKKNKKKYFIQKKLEPHILSNLLKRVSCVVGNSSMGIVECASFKLPVVNIGDRQKGKIEPLNVINCDYDKKSIVRAIKKSLLIKKKGYLEKIKNPYEKNIKLKDISKIIFSLLKNKKILYKRFNKLKLL